MILEAIIIGAIAGTVLGRPFSNRITERILARDEAWIAREIARGEQLHHDMRHNPEAAIAHLEREFGHLREHRADLDAIIAGLRKRAKTVTP